MQNMKEGEGRRGCEREEEIEGGGKGESGGRVPEGGIERGKEKEKEREIAQKKKQTM